MSAEPHSAPAYDWVKSSYSGGNTTECVEAAFTSTGVLVRDSKQPENTHLIVSARAWTQFLAGARGVSAEACSDSMAC
jgi:hypothetical protein